MHPILALGVAYGVLQAGAIVSQHMERHELFNLGKALSSRSRKPFLVVGMPRQPWEYDCSASVMLDLDAAVTAVCPASGVTGDVRAIPYPDRYFGAALVSHVLEHLPSIEAVALAWKELWRVSDVVLIAWPRKAAITSWIAEGHHLWVIPESELTLRVEERFVPNRVAIVSADGGIQW